LNRSECPEASVIIRTFNEERYLGGLFAGLREQTYQAFETIVVDSGSVDRTRAIASELGDQLIRIEPHDFTFGYSLNVGIRSARGRLIVIVSAHTAPADERWLESILAPFADEQVAMVYSRQRGVEASKFGERQDFERTFPMEREVLEPHGFFANNASSAIRRDLWSRHEFDESLPGLEDIEWAKHWISQGYRVVYEPRSAIFHIHQETWPQVRRRYHREAQAARMIGIRRRSELPSTAWREVRHCLADLVAASQTGELPAKASEIVRFRWEKLVGTSGGLLTEPPARQSAEQRQLLFDRPYRAVVIEGPGRAAIRRRQLPQLKPSEVLIRVAFQGVCGTDLEIFDGELTYYKNGLAKYPIVPGHELSGTIAAVGPNVQGFTEGDRVVVECIQGCGRCSACLKDNAIGCPQRAELGVIGLDGGYAEYLVTPSRFVHRIPDSMALAAACLCEPVAVVLKGLRRLERARGNAEPGRCAVVGAGAIGHLTARLLHSRGHEVTVFDRDPRRLELFDHSGVHTAGRADNLADFEVLVEATGDPEALTPTLHQSAAGSTLLLLGLPYAKREFSFDTLVAYDKVVVGSVGSTAQDFREAISAVPTIDTSPFLQHILPLGSVREAWQLARRRDALKVILRNDEGVVT